MSSFHRIKPLSNFDIIQLCNKLKIKDFKGVFMRDELKGKPKQNECLILNIDHSSNSGTHWVCLFIRNGVCFYFDSFGIKPPLEVEDYLQGKERYYSTDEIQKPGEEICGHYCIYMLHRLRCGDKFFHVLDELYKYSHA